MSVLCLRAIDQVTSVGTINNMNTGDHKVLSRKDGLAGHVLTNRPAQLNVLLLWHLCALLYYADNKD